MQATYLSISNGAWRVIRGGLPLSVDKPNAIEAIAAAISVGVAVDPKMPVWNGDRCEWVHADSFAEFTVERIKNDGNGNPRWVVHWMDLENDPPDRTLTLFERYEEVLRRAKVFGGKRYHTKSYAGGVVFQAYGKADVCDTILRILEDKS